MPSRLPALIAIVFLTGCSVGPDYQRPDVELPEDWQDPAMPAAERSANRAEWWRRYDDPALEELVTRATRDNLDLREQTARVREARARLGLSEAQQLPRLDLQADAARQRTSEAAAATGPGGISNDFRIAGALAYELDLWGRLESATEAARGRLLESAFTREAVRLSVITDVVTTYFELRAAERQLEIAERTVDSRERSLEIERARYEGGESSRLPLRQAEAELETTRARIPPIRERINRLESALTVLVGGSPREIMHAGRGSTDGTPLDEIRLPGERPDRLPSELLERRPDIRAAEGNLIAANADIGAAQAEWFPSVNLSALIGSRAAETGDLFSGEARTWSIGGSLLTPLVDFGRIRARVETAEAVREQAEIGYARTVRTAFREVRDALTLYEAANERLAARRRQVQALKDNLETAERRYEGGYTSFIEVLDARRGLLDAELALTEAIRDRFTATASLYKALGGGWSDDTDTSHGTS